MESKVFRFCDQGLLWSPRDEDDGFPFPGQKPAAGNVAVPEKGPFRDHWAYLTAWFDLSADVERGARRRNPEEAPLRRLPALLARSAASLAAGVSLPVEKLDSRLSLDQTDRLLLVALLRDASRPTSDGGLTFARLLNATGAEGLEACEAIRARLETEGTLRTQGLLECNQGPAPSSRLYRLPPALLPELVQERTYAGVPGTTESEAVDFLCRHVSEVQRILAGETRHDASPWRMAPREGPGWSESRAAVEELRDSIRRVTSSKRGAISNLLTALKAWIEQQVLAALLVHDARRSLGGVPAGQALGFVSLVTGTRQTAKLFDPPGLFAEDPFCEVLNGRSGEPGLVRLRDSVAKVLVPGTAALRRTAERTEDEIGAPFDRIAPKTKLDDVVLSEPLRKELDDALATLRTRDLLFGEWGFTSPSYSGNGAILLFEGPPGTGKSYAAEAVAGELDRPLYRIRFDQLQSKWHGETEKQIAAAFRAAEKENAVLVLDEADALLGARDRSLQNWEARHINCLLQEIERFPGIAVFTTNRPGALDPALERRLAARLHFPLPGLVERVALWLAHLPEKAPKAKDIDLVTLAKKFALSGSQIRTAALRAAAAAAQRDGKDRVIRHADLVEAAGRVGKGEVVRAVGF